MQLWSITSHGPENMNSVDGAIFLKTLVCEETFFWGVLMFDTFHRLIFTPRLFCCKYNNDLYFKYETFVCCRFWTVDHAGLH